MATFVLAAIIFCLLFAGMAIGVIFQNKPIKGTCGGLNQMEGGHCEICGGDSSKCDEQSSNDGINTSRQTPPLTYDATKQ